METMKFTTEQQGKLVGRLTELSMDLTPTRNAKLCCRGRWSASHSIAAHEAHVAIIQIT